jgi:TolB protein
MLLRVYRLTDKIGLMLLKLSAAIGDVLLAGTGGVLAGIQKSGSLLLSLAGGLLAILTGLLALLWRGVRGAGRLFLRLIGRGGTLAGSAVRSAGSTAAGTASDAMARRAARDEIDKIVTEDPLKVQNRRLSALVLILGVLVIGAFIWATDPGRSAATPVVAANVDDDEVSSSLFVDATAVPTDEGLGVVPGLATPIPTATPIPAALRVRGTIAYTVRERGQTDLWAVPVGSRDAIRITNDAADERNPQWSPDGSRLAYASRQDGNWELYVYAPALEIGEGNPRRITYDLSFQANPAWSPDGAFVAYESYQGQNLDIYAVPVDGSEAPTRITDHPAPDFSPAWSASGRQIAFTSWRDGNQDIYVLNLDTLDIINLTQTPNRNEDYAAWSPDGRLLAYSAFEQGSEKVFVKPSDEPETPAEVVSFGRTPAWSPDGGSLTFAVDASDGTRTYMYAVPYGRDGGVATEVIPALYGASEPTWSEQTLPPRLVNAGGLPEAISEPLFVEQAERYDDGAPYRLASLPGVQTENANLITRVDDSFNALRDAVRDQTGIDFLGQLDDAFWDINRQPEPGEPSRNWHKTGRAFAIARNSIRGFPPPIEVVREDIGTQTYWRVYVRVGDEMQSGQLGEPLRRMPWDFLSVQQGDVEAYNQGGRLRREVPAGYYVDLTQLVTDYGWQRAAASSDWRANVRGRNYWLFLKPDGLTWYEAMQEIYTEGELVNISPDTEGQ